MSTALIDNNGVRSALGVLNTDGRTLVRISINPSNGGVKVSTTDTISYTPVAVSPRDANFQGCLLYEGTDGLPYPVSVTAAGELLITTT